jgi:peptidylprolyl isomerase
MKSKRPHPKSSFLKNKLAIFIVAFLVFIGVMIVYSSTIGKNTSYPPAGKVLLQTTMGNITIQLYDDMPITTGNFKRLVEQGLYDNTIFHRVIEGFMIQGGNISGVPAIQDEFTNHNRNDNGTVAMANTEQPNTGTSQFFINVANNSYLDSKHPVFGKVIAGMDVVMNISRVETYKDLPENDPDKDRPKTDVTIIKAELLK